MVKVRRCALSECSRSAPEVTLFSFPNDPRRCHLWLEFSKREELKEKPLKYVKDNYRLCSLHFAPSEYLHYGKHKKLHPNALPSIVRGSGLHARSPRKTAKRTTGQQGLTISPLLLSLRTVLSPCSPHLSKMPKNKYQNKKKRTAGNVARSLSFGQQVSCTLSKSSSASHNHDDLQLGEQAEKSSTQVEVSFNELNFLGYTFSSCAATPIHANIWRHEIPENTDGGSLSDHELEHQFHEQPPTPPIGIPSTEERLSHSVVSENTDGSPSNYETEQQSYEQPSPPPTGTPSTEERLSHSVLSGESASGSHGVKRKRRESTPNDTRKQKRVVKAPRNMNRKDYQKLAKSLKVRLKRAEMRTPKHPTLNVKALASNASKYLSKVGKMLFDAQLLLYNCPKYARRWSVEIKNFALSLYFHSPKAYRFLARFLALPSVSTLKRHLKQVPVKPGINERVLQFMSSCISEWDDKDKVCTVLLDEISIQEGLLYNPSSDRIVGFIDDGEKRKNILANEVLCVMVKGITRSWKQMLGYWFTSDKENHETVLLGLEKSVAALENIGLTVKVVIADQGGKNRKAMRKLGINSKRPYFMRQGRKIYFMWDTPHLLKSIRNKLQKYNLTYKNQIIKWQYIKQTFQSSHPVRLKLMPKIASRHIKMNNFKKMKVKLASQILSSSVALTMEVLVSLKKLPRDAEATHLFITDIDKLFDCFNSTQLNVDKTKMRYAISLKSKHISFFKHMESVLEKATFQGTRNGAQPFCMNGWILNIRSLLMLLQDLKDNHNILKLRTRFLNQDALENSFSVIRQQHGCSDNPTPAQFENGFRMLMLMSVPKLSVSSNCEEDNTRYLVSVQNLAAPNTAEESDEEDYEFESNDVVIEGSKVNVKMDDVEQNALYYVTGYLGHQFLKKHQCVTCSAKLQLPKEKQVFTKTYQLLAYGKAYSREFGGLYGNLTIPSDEIYEALMTYEEVFNIVFDRDSHEDKLSKRIISAFLPHCKIELCCDEVTARFIKMVTRTRIYWAVRFRNRNHVDIKAAKRKHNRKVKKTQHGKPP